MDMPVVHVIIVSTVKASASRLEIGRGDALNFGNHCSREMQSGSFYGREDGQLICVGAWERSIISEVQDGCFAGVGRVGWIYVTAFHWINNAAKVASGLGCVEFTNWLNLWHWPYSVVHLFNMHVNSCVASISAMLFISWGSLFCVDWTLYCYHFMIGPVHTIQPFMCCYMSKQMK